MFLPNNPPKLTECPYCGTALTFHQRTHPGYCGRWTCTPAHAAAMSKQQDAARLDAYQKGTTAAQDQTADEIARLAKAQGVDQGKVHIGTVPAMETPLSVLAAERKDAHLAHLAQIIDAAFAQPADYRPAVGRDHTSEHAEPFAWNAAACGTCRGKCCHKGGDAFAFQTVDTIQHLRLRHPDMSAQDIYQYYADALPEVSVEEACVYQGPQGCVLSREMRADICNSFRCYSLIRLAIDVDRTKSDAVAIVSLDNRTAGRVTVLPLQRQDG